MAIAMLMEWEGLTQEQYDRAMEGLRLDENPPEGGIVHIAGPTEGGWCVFDLWESAGAWERFSNERLAPVIQQVGPQGEPRVQIFPVHNLFAPGADEVARMGASSLPGAALRA